MPDPCVLFHMVPDPIFFNLLPYTFFLFGAESMFFYMVSDTCFLCDARSTHVFYSVGSNFFIFGARPMFFCMVPDANVLFHVT